MMGFEPWEDNPLRDSDGSKEKKKKRGEGSGEGSRPGTIVDRAR